MEEHILYTEKKMSWGITMFMGFFALIVIVFLVSQIILGPIGDGPAPTWLLTVIALLFILLTLNFLQINIVLTEKKIKVGYGIFSASRRWEDIAGCEIDSENRFYGWGIRFGKYKNAWIWIYNIIGGPRVVFLSRHKKPRSLMVSTSKPDEIIAVAQKRLAANI